MLTQFRFENFKSWRDTGEIRMAPLTGIFGTNSSGKTAILQFLLMLKQTTESNDRQRVLHTGDKNTYVDLGTFYDISHRHEIPSELEFYISWRLSKALKIWSPEFKTNALFSLDSLNLDASISLEDNDIIVQKFIYKFESSGQLYQFGMQRDQPSTKKGTKDKYKLVTEGYDAKRVKGRPWPLSAPVKTYGFSDEATGYYQNTGFLSDFVLTFEELFQRTYYLGPLREYPQRSYSWAGEQPQDVGRRGERAIDALLASKSLPTIKRGKGRKRQTVEQRVAEWLKILGLIHEFSLEPIAENRKDYEVRVRRHRHSPQVLITDVGFGVSQILPVLVLCYYAPEGSTIILEQPEIHLHPAVQAGLADVFIDVIQNRKIQIIVESHSEHLLRRLQRRIAEEYEDMTSEDAALYFCSIDDTGTSKLTTLELDTYGNINNWPQGFFGDEIGDLVAMTEAAMRRQTANN
jgi:predicted ATPase